MSISKEDEELIFLKQKRPLFQHLKVYQQALQFELNSVLVRTINKEVEVVSPSCPVPKKYKVIYIDEIGVRWVKVISVRGGLGKNIMPIVSEPYGNIEYHIDPELLNSVILGYKYDPRIEYKRMRDQDPKYGKNNGENL